MITLVVGYDTSQKEKDHINKELQRKEVRILDINAVLHELALFKKERMKDDENFDSGDQDFCMYILI